MTINFKENVVDARNGVKDEKIRECRGPFHRISFKNGAAYFVDEDGYDFMSGDLMVKQGPRTTLRYRNEYDEGEASRWYNTSVDCDHSRSAVRRRLGILVETNDDGKITYEFIQKVG